MKTIFPEINDDEILQIFSKIFSGLIAIKNEKDTLKSVYINTIDFDLNGLKLKFNIDMSTHNILIDIIIGMRFEISSKSKITHSDIKNDLDENKYIYSLTGNDNIDRNNIKSMLVELGSLGSHNFINTKNDEYERFLSVGLGNVFCNNMDLGHWLIKVVGRQLGFITGAEYRKLRDIISFESAGIRHEEMELGLLNAFEQSLEIMKNNNITEENSENFNDGDRTIFYVEKDDICGIVHSSQNFMFFTAKNNKTGVIKSWHSMSIEEESKYDWFSNIKDDSECDGNQPFNALEYLSYFADNSSGYSYLYPCELTGAGFQKNFKYYLENFDYDGVDCIYNSEKGFNPNDIESSNYLCFDLECSQNYLTDAFDVKLNTINLSDIDVNSVEYFINSVACIANTRAYALHYLLMVCGNGFHWNGSTYFDGEAVLKKYPSSSTYTDYSEIAFNDPFAFGVLDFKKLPKNASEDWKKAFFELAFYLKEWLLKYPEKDKDGKYLLSVDKYYSENYDDEVVQRIHRYRK